MVTQHTHTELPAGGDNAIAVTLGALGDEWNLWILRFAIQGCRRYGDWIARGRISNSVLATRLNQLTELNLFDRIQYSQRPVRYEYALTERGRGVWPILLMMWAWEQQWAPASPTPLPRMRHTLCGATFTPALTCAHCGQAATRHDVAASLGPSGAWSRSVPTSIARRRSTTANRPSEILPHTMELLGNRWSAAMLGALFMGARRFGALHDMTSAPPAMVADRLRRFQDLEVVTTEPNPVRPDWVTYSLTPKGEAFFPVITLMILWGQHWFRAPEGPAMVFTHRSCGAALIPRLACGHCARELHGDQVLIETADAAV
ncbi:helix-turn-helix transcriptional regulator [Nocardia higoensis]|uniref:Helix-turn-helix transcriptional regulator n=1 Tax=Nocardia higoensis TaxID=228599 RepID=A0ABS0D855_9NOCA|nr:helix-turn-helix domain-containing protein [Nocardia higoensis]MBF6353024.1 helix-turn-helix transcriptional regulator [Nocardia higoensis]